MLSRWMQSPSRRSARTARNGRMATLCSLLLLGALPGSADEARSQSASTAGEDAQSARMSPERLWSLGRIGTAKFSPDGRFVVYSVRRYELAENKGDADLYAVDVASGEIVHVTPGPGSESDVQWVPTADGWWLFYVHKADGMEHAQVWALRPEDGTVRQVTDYPFSVSNLKVDPTGRRLAFTRRVELDPKPVDRYPDLQKAEARIIDSLLYRHWDTWSDYSYSHLFVAELSSDLEARQPVDLMEGLRWHCPTPPFAGSEEFEWSADGEEIAYTMKVSNRPAESTDTDVWLQRPGSGEEARCLTPGMEGYDRNPAYSPDGRWLVFQSMERAGFESDRNRLMLVDRRTGQMRDLTDGFDLSAHFAGWTPDSTGLYFDSDTNGTTQLFHASVPGGQRTQITSGQYNWALKDVHADGRLLVARQSMVRPWELGILPASGGEWAAVTDVNGEIYAELSLPTVHERWIPATDGKQIHSWVILPPDFDPNRRYPLLVYCQGGPQSQIGQWFSYRWNFHLMAAQGYVVVAPNRRGLPGFGQEWNDQISEDWGGQAMQDILSATDSMLTESYVDAGRCAAIGASFGGYTVYWLMGNHDGRFRTMIAHCGLFNLESWYASTEELFFANWDVGGPYWENEALQAAYDRHSPHKYVQNWRTPLLIFHGEKDFRVPINQGMEAFTAAQLRGLKSRFVYFPEEGHWVLSPQNGVLWHREFFRWLDETCGSIAGG